MKTHKKIYSAIILISILSALRSLLVPVTGDEITYLKLSEHILQGKYYLESRPSSLAPVVSLIIALFKIGSYPLFGLVLNKLFNLFLVVLGFRFVTLLLKQQKIDEIITLGILALVAVNPTSIAWFGRLYPESLAFFSFWGFIYYASQPNNKSHLLKMLSFFILLVFTRYVYAVLGLVVLINYYDYLKENFKKYYIPIIKYSIVFLIPLILWGKYLLNIEEQNLSEISYFGRFKIENPIWYNIKCGLGLEKHYEVGKVNGLPAFVSLFVPITGFRNYIVSIVLIAGFIIGLFTQIKFKPIKKMFISIVLIMLGFVFAGTGFSRYWLILLPGFYLGYFYLFKMLNINNKWFVYTSQLICLVYIVNEIRLDMLIIGKYA